MLISPSLQYFSLFGYNIYFYGIVLAIAIFIGFYLANKIAKKYYNITTILDNSIFIIFSGLFGARLYYCILNSHIYFEQPIRILNIREGGLSIHGAIIAGIISIYVLAKKFNYNFNQLCDIFAVILPLSQAIGRWGNFFNSEAFGQPTNSILKLYIAPHFRPLGYEQFDYFHPTFLYESMLDTILFIILYKFALKKYYNFPGTLSGIYLVGYGIIRLLLEPLRLDCTSFLVNIPVPMIISIIMLCIGCFLIKNSLSSK